MMRAGLAPHRASAHRRSAGRFAPWTAWRRLSEAAIAAAAAAEAEPVNLTVMLKVAQALPFPVAGASAEAGAECLRRMARAWIDAAPPRRPLLAPALTGSAETVWRLIEDAAGGAGRPPAWMEG